MENSSHTVTVIIPAYNAGKWLGLCLESVRRQSFPDLRVFVADDGSTDDTEAVATSFASKDNRFTVCRLPHHGVSAARNEGLSFAESEWILFLDADDILHPQALEILLEAAQGTGADAVIPRISYGDIPASTSRIDSCMKPVTVSSTGVLEKLLFRKGVEASICGTLFRRTLFETPEPLRFRDCRYEDLDIGYRVLERAKSVALLPVDLYFYRRHDGSFIRSFSPDRLDALDVTDRMYRHFQGTALEDAAADRRFGAHCNILLVLLTYGVKDDASIRRCLDVIRHQRFRTLTSGKVRVRNRLGALLSYGGLPAMRLAAKIFPQR